MLMRVCVGLIILVMAIICLFQIDYIGSSLGRAQRLIGDRRRDSPLDEEIEFLRKYSTQQADERRKFFERNRLMEYPLFYNTLVPEALCVGKTRVGNAGDGGKWVCNPTRIPRNDCVIYSLGLNNLIVFDIELQKIADNRCLLRGVDVISQNRMTMDAYKKMNGIVFLNKIGGPSSSSAITLGDLMAKAGDKTIEILKIDIEGAEADVIPPFLDKVKPCQILMETHYDATRTTSLLQNIANKGYLLFSFEINGYGLQYCEYGFIHESCMERYDARSLARYLNF